MLPTLPTISVMAVFLERCRAPLHALDPLNQRIGCRAVYSHGVVAMNSWSFRRAVLALVIGLGIVAGLVRGQDMRPMPGATASIPTASSRAVVGVQYAADPYPQAQSARPRIVEHLNRQGLHCFATLGSLGCGSCKSECQFIFGSCRTFFGEPCIPQPPQENGALGAQTYGILGRAKSGCGCP
jgi:hypothetical protein